MYPKWRYAGAAGGLEGKAGIEPWEKGIFYAVFSRISDLILQVAENDGCIRPASERNCCTNGICRISVGTLMPVLTPVSAGVGGKCTAIREMKGISNLLSTLLTVTNPLPLIFVMCLLPPVPRKGRDGNHCHLTVGGIEVVTIGLASQPQS